MMIAPALKKTAREIAMKLTLEDILKMVYIIDAWLDIQEEIRRTAEKFNRIMGTRQMFRSPQEAIMYEMLQRELMGTPKHEEEEEEVDEETATRARMKLDELISKIKQKVEEKEIARAKTTLEKARAYGLIEPEEEQEIRGYIEKKEKQLKGHTETEKEEKE